LYVWLNAGHKKPRDVRGFLLSNHPANTWLKIQAN